MTQLEPRTDYEPWIDDLYCSLNINASENPDYNAHSFAGTVARSLINSAMRGQEFTFYYSNEHDSQTVEFIPAINTDTDEKTFTTEPPISEMSDELARLCHRVISFAGVKR